MNKKYLLLFLFLALITIIYIRNHSEVRISAEDKPKLEEPKKTCDHFIYNGDILVPATGPTSNINNVTPVAMPCIILANTEKNREKLTEFKINFLGGLDSKKEDVIIIPGAVINPGKGGDVINIPESKKTLDLGILDRIDIDLSADFTINLGSGTNQIHIQPVFDSGFGGLYPCKKPIDAKFKGGYCTLYTVLKNNEICSPPKCSAIEELKPACITDYYKSDKDVTQISKIPGINIQKVTGQVDLYEIEMCGTIKNKELVFGGNLSQYINSGIIKNGDTVYGYFGGLTTDINPVVTRIKINQDVCPDQKHKPIPIDNNTQSSLLTPSPTSL